MTIEDVASHEDSSIESDVLSEQGITCEFERTEQQVTLKMKGDVSNLANLRFLNSRGKEIEPDGWSSGGGGNSWQYSYDFEKVPKANLLLDFRIDPETITLLFEAKQISIAKN